MTRYPKEKAKQKNLVGYFNFHLHTCNSNTALVHKHVYMYMFLMVQCMHKLKLGVRSKTT